MIVLDVNKVNFGCFLNISDSGLVEMIATSGFDFIILDMEHGAFNWKELEDGVRACDVANTPSVVRVPECRREYILRALDSGASAIQVPMIDTREKAEEVVRLAKYPPMGIRGTSFGHRSAKYGNLTDKADYLYHSNQNTKVIIQIENPKGVENLDEILEVEGIDIIFFGPTDLAVSMGYGSDLKHSEVKKTISQIKDKALDLNKKIGILGINIPDVKNYKNEGFTYLTTNFQSVYNPEAKRWLDSIRD